MILRKATKKAYLALSVALLCGPLSWAQNPTQAETVLIKRATPLRDGPTDASRSVMDLPLQTPVVRLGDRQGAWIKVRTADNSQGWVHMFDVTSPAGTSPSASNIGTSALRGITGFFNRGSSQAPGANVATSTLGIRGLDAENLNNAQPNVAALAQAETLRVDATQARRFGSAESLVTRTVEPLPQPEVNP